MTGERIRPGGGHLSERQLISVPSGELSGGGSGQTPALARIGTGFSQVSINRWCFEVHRSVHTQSA